MISGAANLVIYILKNPKKFLTAILVIVTEGPFEIARRFKINYYNANYPDNMNLVYQKWIKKNYPNKNKLKNEIIISQNFKFKPKISIITPTYNTNLIFLRDCIDSVLNQTYKNWELCLVDDASLDEKIREIILNYVKKDKRIKYFFRKSNGHISKATNDGLKLASGKYVALLDHDDILWPNAIFEIVKSLNYNRSLKFIYTDEDRIVESGKHHFGPVFKPDWNPDFLRSANYIVHFVVIEKKIIEKIGGFRSKVDGAQDWDLFLRVSEFIEKKYSIKDICHLPKILYSWRVSETSTANDKKGSKIKSYAFVNQEEVLKDDLERRHLKGNVKKTKQLGIWKNEYQVEGKPLISIIIPTKECFKYIKTCINTILNKSSYNNFEIIVVDTGSSSEKVLNFYDEIKKNSKVKIFNFERIFNFSEACNFGAKKSSGKYFIFLNNDTKIINKDWIENMLQHAQRKATGAVGCKLLFPNKTIQHAGVILGLNNPQGEKVVAGHAYKGFPDYYLSSFIIDCVKNYSAVTAACLMIDRKKFNQVGGFDPIFRIAYNDVDFCLKLQQKGYYNVYTPYSVLYHFESISVGQIGEKKRDLKEYRKEVNLMYSRWKSVIEYDPNYNINLTRDKEDFSLAV